MKSSMQAKLESLVERHEEIGALLSDPETMADQNKFRDLSKEYAQLEPVVACYAKHLVAVDAINSSEVLLKEEDEDMREMAKEELAQAQQDKEALEGELQILLLPKDPSDDKDIYLEVRAGTGGDEAAIFAGDLFRMYSRYAERQGWRVEVMNTNEGEHGGYKEVIAKVSGTSVYAHLKFESGAHRVQRVPETESQGRVHTSACTVAILPVVESVDEFIINADDLRIDTYRSSGAGGQHVNVTDSAVRITHVPTGVVVECQDERSQHKNKAKAMALLQSRLLAAEQNKQQQEQADARRSLVGSGDRSERIRTYNYPQGRVTDHRINLTLYKLDDIVQGDLSEVVQALLTEYQASQLAELGLGEQ